MSEDYRKSRQGDHRRGQQGAFKVHISQEDYEREMHADEYELRAVRGKAAADAQRNKAMQQRSQGSMSAQDPNRRSNVPVSRTRVITSEEGERYEIPDESMIPASLLGKLSKNNRSRGCIVAVVYAIIIVSISALLAFYLVVGINDMFALVKEDMEIVVPVPAGADIDDITKLLDENGVVDYPFFFKLYAQFTRPDAEFKDGNFTLNRKSDYGHLIDRLTQPAIAEDGVVKITFREGLTVREIGELLDYYCVCDYDKYMDTIENYPFKHEFLKNIPMDDPNRVYRLEGYLFPDTYAFYVNEGSISAVNKMLNNFEARVLDNKSVLFSQKAEELGYTMDQIIILASIIERESNDKEEMKKVASVFYNRLENKGFEGIGGKLQSDATAWYPFPTGPAMRESELLTDEEKANWQGAYNTNINAGLPKGAICCPGLNSINAALNPANTNYFYFFIDNESNHYYAKTYNQHLKNIDNARANGTYSG